MNKAKFYETIRDKINLTTQNVFGFEMHLDYAHRRQVKLQKLKYILATSYWETGGLMTPVVEAHWLSENWRKRNLRYYPWHGRGLIQTTWEDNYKKVDDMLVLKGKLMEHPELLLNWQYALPALFIGMETGLYTKKKLDDFIDDKDESDAEDRREMINARRIVNGTDKAAKIAELGLLFEKALKAAKWEYDVTTSRNPKGK